MDEGLLRATRAAGGTSPMTSARRAVLLALLIEAPCLWLMAPQIWSTVAAPLATAQTTPSAEESFANGVSRMRAGDYSGAVEEFTRAVQRSPRLVEAYVQRARARFWLGEF